MGSAMCTCHLEQPTLKRPAILREQHRAPKHPVKTTASRPLVTMTTAIEIVPQYTTPSPTETVRAALPSEEGNQAATAHTVQFPIHTLSDVPVHESISIHSTRPFGTRRSAGQLIRSASTSGAASSNAAGTSHNLGRWRPLSNLDESTSHNLSLISDDSGDHHVPPRHARARASVATVLAPVALMGGRNDSTTSGSSFTSNEQQPCTGVGNSFRQINAVEPRKSAIGGPRFVTI